MIDWRARIRASCGTIDSPATHVSPLSRPGFTRQSLLSVSLRQSTRCHQRKFIFRVTTESTWCHQAKFNVCVTTESTRCHQAKLTAWSNLVSPDILHCLSYYWFNSVSPDKIHCPCHYWVNFVSPDKLHCLHYWVNSVSPDKGHCLCSPLTHNLSFCDAPLTNEGRQCDVTTPVHKIKSSETWMDCSSVELISLV